MINEIGTDVTTFNINDYIWYIVGGVALFFVIVGFIADKSGLAKKTFSKDSKKGVTKKVEPEQNIVTENDVVDSLEVTPVVTEPIVEEMPPMMIEDNLTYETTDDMNADKNGIIGESGPLYISEEPEVPADEFISVGQDINSFDGEVSPIENEPVSEVSAMPEESDIESDKTDVWDNDEIEQETVIDSLENDENIEDFSMDSLENNEVVENDMVFSDIAAEDAENEWGVDSISTTSDDNDSVEVNLPNLEDIEINAEDDVWKF